MTTFTSEYRPRPLEATFGYFISVDSKTETMTKMRRNINLMNGLGYIPVIGTIIGIARVIFFGKFIPEYRHYSGSEKKFACFQVARGYVEMFSLGAVFLIPDLIITINRELEMAMKSTWFHDNCFGNFKGDYY